MPKIAQFRHYLFKMRNSASLRMHILPKIGEFNSIQELGQAVESLVQASAGGGSSGELTKHQLHAAHLQLYLPPATEPPTWRRRGLMRTRWGTTLRAAMWQRLATMMMKSQTTCLWRPTTLWFWHRKNELAPPCMMRQ